MPKYRSHTITYRVTQASFNRVAKMLDTVAEQITERADEVLEKAAKRGAELAQDEFANAYYDGVNDVKVEPRQTQKGKWSITASGRAALPIEYGTGARAGHTGKQHWYFSADTSDPRFQLSGGRMATYTRIGRESDYVDENGNTVRGEKNGIPEVVERTDSAHTYGNKPNHCMLTAYGYLIDDLPDIIDEVMKK